MALILVKMAIQNVEYTKHSQSVVVASCFYAATAHLKLSKKFNDCPYIS